MSLGNEICRHILFAHALTGCDTTSRIFNIGKVTVMKLLSTDEDFRKASEMFLTPPNATKKDDIASAGETAMKRLYGESGDISIDELRLQKFKTKAASKPRITQIEASSLPPTKAACYQHSMRVFLQVQAWMALETQLFVSTDWGWELKDDQMFRAVYMDKPLAPEDLLKIIRCGCKGDCNTNRCVCRKNGLMCSDVCKEGRGLSCSN